MTVYTPMTKVANGGQDGIEAVIYEAIEDTNQAYINSLVSQRIRLVFVGEVGFNELPVGWNMTTQLGNLRNSLGPYAAVGTLRNQHAADLVVMMVHQPDPSLCGIAYMQNPISAGFDSSAYGIVRTSCAVGNHTFAHELGHLMGASHETPVGATPDARAYVSTALSWRTIMATIAACSGCPRLHYFSNPNVLNGTEPMGVFNFRNHANTLNTSAQTVANFRCAMPPLSGVWMKDTWADTGAEPDPATATEEMWKSPYIWVRNTPDPGRLKQHQHQNPEAGALNYIYVKLHNAGPLAAAGTLQVWVANASTGLSWQGNWTQVGSATVNGFAAQSTQAVEVLWNIPKDWSGHFCLIARWVSSTDPMTTTEGMNIDFNTRQNNNIVWRNVNIVDLLPDKAVDVSFIFRNPTRERMVATLIVKTPANEAGARSFLRAGAVQIAMPPAMVERWRQAGGRGAGFVVQRDGSHLIAGESARFEGILLEAGEQHAVRLAFRATPATQRQRYTVDVLQGMPNVGRMTLLGGVSYEIYPPGTPKTPVTTGLTGVNSTPAVQ